MPSKGVVSIRGREIVQSPVLVGRDEFLALADRRLAEVEARCEIAAWAATIST